MKAAVIVKTKQPIVFEDRPIPRPGPGQIRIKVAACGVCHSDYHIWEGVFDFAKLPVIPGHEVAGVVDQLGEGVTNWRIGDRAGMPWVYSACGFCNACVAGNDHDCDDHQATGVTVDGGYAPYMIAPAAFATRIPAELDLAEAAPLFCAGLTVYGALRAAGVQVGMTVAVQGIGGLGHLGLQFARALGAHVIALTRGSEKCEFAHSLGAAEAIDADRQAPADVLRRRGGADVILSTIHRSEPIAPLVGALARHGTLALVGAAYEPMTVIPAQLLGNRGRILGSVVGNRRQMREVLDLAVKHNIRPIIERYRLEDVPEIFARMEQNQIRYRAVLTF